MSPDSVLSIIGLDKSFGRTHALRGVDLDVPKGSICGFVGLNGAGKTTTLECSLGLLGGYRGTIRILGEAPTRIARGRGRLGVVFDSPCLAEHLSVRNVLRHSELIVGRDGRSPAEVQELLGLTRYERVKVRHLSLGNRKRAAIAVALVGKPDFVILDEPFTGLDTGGVDDLSAIIEEINRRDGTTFLLSSHHLQHVERICTDLTIVHEGRVVAHDGIEELLAGGEPRLRLRAVPRDAAEELLRAREDVTDVNVDGDDLVMTLEAGSADAVNAALVRAGVGVSHLVVERRSLESVFREKVGIPCSSG